MTTRQILHDRCFWLALVLSVGFHAGWFGALWALHFWLPTRPPMLLLPYGDADVAGLSVGAVSADSGSLYQDTVDRPGGEVLPGPLSRDPAPAVIAAEGAQPEASPIARAPQEPLPVAMPEVVTLPEPAPLAELDPVVAPEKSAPEPVAKTAPAATAAASDRGLRAPNGLGTNPAETPGLGKAKGEQGSSRMAPGTPSAGGRVGYTTGVSLVSYPKPAYPLEAKQAGHEGTVLVWLRVSAEGQVLEVRLDRSSGYPLLDQAALQFARTVRLYPARLGTIAVEGEARLPVVYRLLN